MKDYGLTALDTKVFQLQAVATRASSFAMLFCQFCLLWKDHLPGSEGISVSLINPLASPLKLTTGYYSGSL